MCLRVNTIACDWVMPDEECVFATTADAADADKRDNHVFTKAVCHLQFYPFGL